MLSAAGAPMSAVLSRPGMSSPWPMPLLGLSLLLVANGLLYLDTWVAMVGIWARSDTFAHAFLVPPIVAWLVWRRRAFVARHAPRPAWSALPLVALAALAWLLGDLAGVNALTQAAVVALAVAVVPAALGWAAARELAFPLAFAFFMVPVGEFLLPVMMERTADFTVAALVATGIPVYREGLQFVIPSGTWSVVEACSGVRYLIASFMVGTLFAYINYRSARRRLLFCLVSIAVPVVANWLRAYMIVMLGHLSGNTIAVGVDHLIYGWVFFGVVIGLMFFIGARWAEPDAEPPAAREAGDTGAAPYGRAGQAALALALALLALPPLLTGHWAADKALPVRLALPELPGQAVRDTALRVQPRFEGAALQASRVYAGAAGEVGLHIAYYRQQGYGRKLVSGENQIVRAEDDHWQRTRSGRAELAGSPWRTHELLSGGMSGRGLRDRLEVRQVLWVDGRLTDSDLWATAYGLRGRLAGRGDDAAAVTLVLAGPAESTGPALDNFIREHLGAIVAALEQARAAR